MRMNLSFTVRLLINCDLSINRKNKIGMIRKMNIKNKLINYKKVRNNKKNNINNNYKNQT